MCGGSSSQCLADLNSRWLCTLVWARENGGVVEQCVSVVPRSNTVGSAIT